MVRTNETRLSRSQFNATSRKIRNHTQDTELMNHKRADLIADFTKWSGGFPPEDSDQITVYLDYTLPSASMALDQAKEFYLFAHDLLVEWMERETEDLNKNRPFLAVCTIRDIIERRGLDEVKEHAIRRCIEEYPQILAAMKKHELVELLVTKIGVIACTNSGNALADELVDTTEAPDEYPEGIDESDECALMIAANEEKWGG